ncbi:hypothetical protein RclHR1_01500009 [Rhizophagus clarus]|uniref:Protein kinase domain-containing protein n=1 Tax=Rhizophagus clarus TaxID=94130 RepID=A0A2Z6QRL9_9GLOM|nr:hypothetical protein RclHR1_01500009 [Rhizophagus clarus]
MAKLKKERIELFKKANLNNPKITVAIKRLNNLKISENDFKEFITKLKAFRNINHSNINRFFGLTRDSNNDYFLVWEYVNEGNLRDYLENNFNTLQWNDKIQMALDITRGLTVLHSELIIHGNLRAHAILIKNGKSMITDFGSSVEVASSVTENIVYAEPHHLHDPSYNLDMRSDIYSLGVLLWELSSGHPPFSNHGSGAFSLAQIVIGIVNGKREDPIENTPLEYQELYQKCWQDNPDKRPEINEVHEILSQLNLRFKIFNDLLTKQQIIKRFKLNYGLILTEDNIIPSMKKIFDEDGKLNMSLYEEQPIVYININMNKLRPSDTCINFPIVEITYNGDSLKTLDNKLSDHFFARKILVGGKLLIKEFSSATRAQCDILKHNILSINDLESNEKQPGIVNFNEKLSLEEWIGDARHDNMVKWTNNFDLFKGLIINQDCDIKISKKIAINFNEIPKVNSNDKVYSKMITPSTNLEVILISNNIFSIKNLNTFPFINNNIIKSYNDHIYNLFKYERYEITLNKDHIKPTGEFEQLIDNALNSIMPLKTLKDIFNEYGHLFPQRIILGRSLKNILPNTTTSNIDVEKNDLSNWIQNTNNNLEIIEFDNIIPLYKILEVEQQRKIDSILKNNFKIIMTGITDLKDLDNNNVVHYKRINLNSKSVLESEDYEVFGSIISEDNTKLEEICVNFGLYNYNRFYAIIKTLKEPSIDITRCYVLWMIVGNSSKFPVLSQNNREFQVDCIKESITIQPDKSNYCIKTPFPLFQGHTVSVHAYYSSTNYEPINTVKLVGWDNDSINVQIYYNRSNRAIISNDVQLDEKINLLTNIEIDLHICILSINYKSLKIDEKVTQPNESEPITLGSYSTLEEINVPILTRKEYGFGREGRRIIVKANSFEVLEISKYDKFFKYNIEINPLGRNIESDVKRERSDYGKSTRRKVLKKLCLKMENWFQGVVYAYDGGTILYTTGYLGFDKDDTKSTVKEEISLVDFQNLDDEPTRYNIIINRSDTVVKLTQLKKYISGEEFKWDFCSDEAFNVLNALIHKVGSESYTQSGKSSIYNKEIKKIIRGGVELWSGWFSTVRPGQGSLFINVNPTFSAFYQSLNLDDFLLQCFRSKYKSLPNEFNNFEMVRINKVLRGVFVRLQHLEPMQTERRIKKLLTTKQVARFKYKSKKDSRETPLEGYFNDKIEKYYKDNNQSRKSTKFFVELMSDEDIKIAWPIEFCKIIEGQRYSNKKLTGTQQGEIILAAKRRPSMNESETIKGAQEILQLQNDPIGIGMKVSSNLTRVDARVLESTDIKYAGKTMKPINGQWNLKNMMFVESGERLEFWHVIIFEQNRWMPENEAINFIENLARQCEQQGMNIARNMPAIQYLQYRGPESVKKAYNDARKKLNRPPQMILFIIPGEKSPINTELYETIKRIMDTEVGCLSQCVSIDSRRNFRNPQYCANLSMKMNLKLGGLNSYLPEEKIRLPNGDEVLFLGADVTHPKDKTGRSICAVVGSLDNKAARYVTKYRDQERSGKEEILKIDEMIKEILEKYCDYQEKKRMPRKM